MAPRRQRPEDPVAVTAAFADSFHFHVPVVARAVTSTVQFDHPLRAAIVAVAVEQQFNAVGPGSRQHKVHTSAGEAAAQGPGRTGVNATQGPLGHLDFKLVVWSVVLNQWR